MTDLEARDKKWAKHFLEGKSHGWIGERYGVTRQCVQLRLAKMGLARKDGGRALIGRQAQAAKIAAAKQRRANWFMELFGVPEDEVTKINGKPFVKREQENPPSIAMMYYNQRRYALRDGVPWELSFRQWWMIWQRSGKWGQRGITQYVLGRKVPKLGFVPGNVRVISMSALARATRKRERTPPTTGGQRRRTAA